MADNLDKLVQSGVRLQKAIAMEGLGSTSGSDNAPASKGYGTPTTKEDIGLSESGIGATKSDKY